MGCSHSHRDLRTRNAAPQPVRGSVYCRPAGVPCSQRGARRGGWGRDSTHLEVDFEYLHQQHAQLAPKIQLPHALGVWPGRGEVPSARDGGAREGSGRGEVWWEAPRKGLTDCLRALGARCWHRASAQVPKNQLFNGLPAGSETERAASSPERRGAEASPFRSGHRGRALWTCSDATAVPASSGQKA